MKRTKYPIHPDFKRWANMNPPLNRAVLPVMQKLLGLLFFGERSTKELTVEHKTIPADSGHQLRALWYRPKDMEEKAPCLLVFHGASVKQK